jgi:hypothetical protein
MYAPVRAVVRTLMLEQRAEEIRKLAFSGIFLK